MSDDIKHIPRVVPSPVRTGMTHLSTPLLETHGVHLLFGPFARTDQPAHHFALATTSEGMSACRIETGHILVIGISRVGKTRVNETIIHSLSSDE